MLQRGTHLVLWHKQEAVLQASEIKEALDKAFSTIEKWTQ